MNVKNPVNALHALLASSGFGAIADALVNLHGAAQAGGFAAGVTALAVTAVSAAAHSRKVAELAHTITVDESRLVTPGVIDRLHRVESAVAAVVPIGDVRRAVSDEVAKAVAGLPAPVKATVEDVRPLVEEVLAPLAAVLPKTTPAVPAEPATPAA